MKDSKGRVYPKHLSEIGNTIRDALIDQGLCEARAARVTRGAVEVLWTNVAGRMLYVPTLKVVHRWQRNEQIREKFTGNNHGELALEFDITERAVYKILKQLRDERADKYLA